MSLKDWSAECEKRWASEITLKYPAGEMTVDFRTFVKDHNYTQKPVKRLLKLSNAENRVIMLQTVDTIMGEIQTEFRKVMDEYEERITNINNSYLFEYEREGAKKPVIAKCKARRKALNARYEKLMKIRGLIENEQI